MTSHSRHSQCPLCDFTQVKRAAAAAAGRVPADSSNRQFTLLHSTNVNADSLHLCKLNNYSEPAVLETRWPTSGGGMSGRLGIVVAQGIRTVLIEFNNNRYNRFFPRQLFALAMTSEKTRCKGVSAATARSEPRLNDVDTR